MNNLKILKFIISGVLLLSYMQTSYAVCTVTGATGTGGDIVSCSGVETAGYNGTVNGDDITVLTGANVSDTTANDDTIFTGAGADNVVVSGGSVTSLIDAIRTNAGDDTVVINSGTISAPNGDTIRTDTNNDTVTINGGTLNAFDDVIRTNSGNDTVVINGGTLNADDDVISTSTGNDTITINGGTLNAGANGNDSVIEAGSGNDVITLNGGTLSNAGTDDVIEASTGNDTVIISGNVSILAGSPAMPGIIDGGPANDTLRFTLAVPPADLAALQATLLAANPAGDSIVINGNTYSWRRFEVIEAQLTAIQPVPTLQQWGIMLLISLLGLIGMIATRRNRYFL